MNLFAPVLSLLVARVLGAANGASLAHELVLAVTEGDTVVIQQLLRLVTSVVFFNASCAGRSSVRHADRRPFVRG